MYATQTLNPKPNPKVKAMEVAAIGEGDRQIWRRLFDYWLFPYMEGEKAQEYQRDVEAAEAKNEAKKLIIPLLLTLSSLTKRNP